MLISRSVVLIVVSLSCNHHVRFLLASEQGNQHVKITTLSINAVGVLKKTCHWVGEAENKAMGLNERTQDAIRKKENEREGRVGLEAPERENKERSREHQIVNCGAGCLLD